MQKISSKVREDLKKISTATIATSLFKRGFRNQCIQNVSPLKLHGESMVGEAYTLRYIPAREDLNTVAVFKNVDHPQRVAVENCPKDAILVIDSRNNPRAASAGSILITRLMKRGVAGIVTDGGFRDSQEISELDFSSFHQRPSAPTNLTLHQAIDINVPIACGDVAVFPNDILVGDADGVIVIPFEIVEEITKECTEMTLFENFVLEKVNNGATIIGLYPLTNPSIKKEYEEWRSKQN